MITIIIVAIVVVKRKSKPTRLRLYESLQSVTEFAVNDNDTTLQSICYLFSSDSFVVLLEDKHISKFPHGTYHFLLTY